ncbi:hypothetical protein GCM10009016_11160 [Halomonas beimenensis]
MAIAGKKMEKAGQLGSAMVACALLACADPTIMTRRPFTIDERDAREDAGPRAPSVRTVKMERHREFAARADSAQTVATTVSPASAGVPDARCDRRPRLRC